MLLDAALLLLYVLSHPLYLHLEPLIVSLYLLPLVPLYPQLVQFLTQLLEPLVLLHLLVQVSQQLVGLVLLLVEGVQELLVFLLDHRELSIVVRDHGCVATMLEEF